MTVARSLVHHVSRLRSLVETRLWLQVLIGMAAGIGFGIAIGPSVGWVDPEVAEVIGNWAALPGTLFLLAIQFVVVPLVVASVIRGIAAGEGADRLGRLGAVTVAFFLLTTLVAVFIGLAAAAIIEPGRFIDGETLRASLGQGSMTEIVPQAASLPRPGEIPDLIARLFPRDPLVTFISGNMLQIVITAVIIGVALVMIPVDQRKPLLDLLASIQAACMAIVGVVLRFAPLAVFGLLAQISARVGLSAMIGTGVYVLTVLCGLALLFALYLAIVVMIGRRAPRPFLAAIRDVMLLAFSTSSSAAVMPLTLTTAEHKLRVREPVARFVVPLGTTINMGGTALYQGVAALFLAQVFGIEIGFAGLVLITVVATSAAIGSPGTPGVGIVILATILDGLGIPAAGVAIILGVDRILDMCRTVVNVTGDLVAAVTIDRFVAIAGETAPAALTHVPTPGMPHAADSGADRDETTKGEDR